MHLSSHIFDGPRQQPNCSGNQDRRDNRVEQRLSVLDFQPLHNAGQEDNRRERQDDDLDGGKQRGHVASESRQNATDSRTLKALATRANDVLLIVLITVIGVVALFAAHTGFSRVERAYEIAGRV